MQGHGLGAMPLRFFFGGVQESLGYALAFGFFGDGDRLQMCAGLVAQRFGAKAHQGQSLYDPTIAYGDMHETVIRITRNPFAKQCGIIAPQMLRVPGFRDLKIRQPRH